MKKENAIYIVISICAILIPISFLIGILESKIAFPIIFILLGCQQLFYGFFLVSKENKGLRITSLIFGGFFMLFGFLFVLPSYYL